MFINQKLLSWVDHIDHYSLMQSQINRAKKQNKITYKHIHINTTHGKYPLYPKNKILFNVIMLIYICLYITVAVTVAVNVADASVHRNFVLVFNESTCCCSWKQPEFLQAAHPITNNNRLPKIHYLSIWTNFLFSKGLKSWRSKWSVKKKKKGNTGNKLRSCGYHRQLLWKQQHACSITWIHSEN